MNSFGHILRLTTFGESHGTAIGGVLDGMPAGVSIDTDLIQQELDRRRPGQSALTTSRQEQDRVELLSGLLDGITTGTPIGFCIRNNDHRSSDYEDMRTLFRPSHADFTYQMKYGLRDHRGGGRSSARETACRVVGGALAKAALRTMGIHIQAYTTQVGTIALPPTYQPTNAELDTDHPTRCPHPDTAQRMEELIRNVAATGDTVGGIVACTITGCPPGLGEPVGSKLQAALAAAMLSINAAHGFDYGDGFAMAAGRGSELNDPFEPAPDGTIRTTTNHSGGIQGGISNGADIRFRVAFKPAPTLLQPQSTTDDYGQPATLHARGRHDPCVVPRAVPVVEAMAALVLLDHALLARCSRI